MASLKRRDTKSKPFFKDAYEGPPQMSLVSQGQCTLSIPLSVFEENRQRLIEALKGRVPHGIIFFGAAPAFSCGVLTSFYEQDSYFFWAFGYTNPGAMGAIDIWNKKSFLFVQRQNREGWKWRTKKWMKRKDIRQKWMVDGVWYFDELDIFLDFMIGNNYCKDILTLPRQRENLPPSILSRNCDIDNEEWIPALEDLKNEKTKQELRILKYIVTGLERAILHFLKALTNYRTVGLLRASFNFFMGFKSGCRHTTFSVTRGEDSLEDETFMNLGEVVCIDVGAAYFSYYVSLGYTIPVGRNFTPEQSIAYVLVLNARECILQHLECKVTLASINSLAETDILQNLISPFGLLNGTVKDALKVGLGRLLMPQRAIRPLDFNCDDNSVLEEGKIYMIEPNICFGKGWMEMAEKDESLKSYLTEGVLGFVGIVAKLSEPVLVKRDGYLKFSNVDVTIDTIEEFRKPTWGPNALLQDDKNTSATLELLSEDPKLYTIK